MTSASTSSEEPVLEAGLLPQHIAIIMDGNGRWAQQRGHNRFWGHLRGAKVAKEVIKFCTKNNVDTLSLFAFSTENWHRPLKEIQFLMRLLERNLLKEPEWCLKSFVAILDDPSTHDITFKTSDGGSVSGHRAIIAAGSPVFHAMLYGNMKESNEKEIKLP